MVRVCRWGGWGNLRGREHLEFYASGYNIQRDLKKYDGGVWNRVIWFRIKTSGRFL